MAENTTDFGAAQEGNAERLVYQPSTIDGWETRSSEVFNGFLEIVKTRKDDDPISIHIDPTSGRVRKFAGTALFNPRIEKEERLWQQALEVFGINEEVQSGSMRRLKTDPSKGYEEVKYLDMPYMGIPIKSYRAVSPGEVSGEAKELFTQRMVRLVKEKHVFFPDMNEGNVLVRLVDGQEVLFPIDWESAQTNRVAQNTDYYIAETQKRCAKLFAKEKE